MNSKDRSQLMLLAAAAVLVMMLLLCGCVASTKQTADMAQRERTAQAMAEADRQIGMPAIVNYQERKLAKMIFELRDQEDFVCYAYLVNAMTGEVGQFLGKCLGYGLPYSVQFTNPERIASCWRELGYDRVHSSGSFLSLPQPDPNGLFMPEGLSATWLMLLDDNGEARPVYIEPQIIVSPFPLHDGVKTLPASWTPSVLPEPVG